MKPEDEQREDDEAEEEAATAVEPLNLKYPFTLKPFPYLMAGAGQGPPLKREVGIP